MWWIIIIIFLVVAAIYSTVSDKNKKTAIAEGNSSFSSQLAKRNFIAEKKITFGSNILFIDNSNKKWCVKAGTNSYIRIYDFDKLTHFEIIEDGNSIASGRVGSALVGGILFGGVGAIIGASRKQTIKNNCTLLQLRIKVNDFSNPEIIIHLINEQVSKDLVTYKNAIEAARIISSNLSYIQNNI